MYVYVTLTEGLKCVLQTQNHSFGEGGLLSALLPTLKAQAGDQVEDTERTPAQRAQHNFLEFGKSSNGTCCEVACLYKSLVKS